jgi:hypothetical protein
MGEESPPVKRFFDSVNVALLATPVFLVVFFLRFQRAVVEGERIAADERVARERPAAGYS